jgi:hypothetical protein
MAAGEVELVGEGGEVRCGGKEETLEGAVVGVGGAVERVVVGGAFERGHGGVGAVEAGEGPGPLAAKGLGSARRGFSTTLEANGKGRGGGDGSGARGA